MIWIDDLIILRQTYEEYLTGSIKVTKLFLRLEFLMHRDKSSFLSSQEIAYQRFIFDSANIFLSVTDDKKDKIQKSCWKGVLKDLISSQSYSKNIDEKQWHVSTLWNENCTKSLNPCINNEKIHIKLFPDWTVAITCIKKKECLT